MSNITIAWDDSATDEVKLERLITQKWIALFPDGQEGWNEIRRTGYPKVFPVAQSTSGYTIKVPNRIPFDSVSSLTTELRTKRQFKCLEEQTTTLQRCGGKRNKCVIFKVRKNEKTK